MALGCRWRCGGFVGDCRAGAEESIEINTKKQHPKRQLGANGRLYVISKDIGIRQIRYLGEAFVLAVIVGYRQHFWQNTVGQRQHFLCCRPQNGANQGARVADGERRERGEKEIMNNP